MSIKVNFVPYEAKQISKDLCGLQVKGAKWPENLKVLKDPDCGSHFQICMTEGLVVKNMQEDSAAFEGWSMVLRSWFNAESVTLSWTPPTNIDVLHYQRFLYRVIRFQQAMQDWFMVSDESILIGSKVLFPDGHFREGDFWLNYEMDSRGCDSKGGDALACEDALEREFCRNPTSLLACSNAKDGLNRQLPVGLFFGEVKKNSKENKPQVFPGGKAAIDLWATKKDGKTIIYELKKPNNKKIGAITELFFYAILLRDLQKNNNLNFCVPKNVNREESTTNKISDGKGVDAYILIDKIHPLLNEMIFSLMNHSFTSSEIHFGYISYSKENYECKNIF